MQQQQFRRLWQKRVPPLLCKLKLAPTVVVQTDHNTTRTKSRADWKIEREQILNETRWTMRMWLIQFRMRSRLQYDDKNFMRLERRLLVIERFWY